jgi:hypothetical protein
MKKLLLLVALAGCPLAFAGCENKPVTTPPPADTSANKPADAPAPSAAEKPTEPAPNEAAPAPADPGKAP